MRGREMSQPRHRAYTAFQYSRRTLLNYPLPATTLLGTEAQSWGLLGASTSIFPWQVDSLLRGWGWIGAKRGGQADSNDLTETTKTSWNLPGSTRQAAALETCPPTS